MMPNYNSYMRDYNAERYARRRTEFEELLGGKCVHCGSLKNLEFDHIDPETKEHSIAQILLGRTERVLKELKKCQLLCRECHEEKTQNELKGREPWNKGQATHGKQYAACTLKCSCDLCKEYRDVRNAKRRAQRRINNP